MTYIRKNIPQTLLVVWLFASKIMYRTSGYIIVHWDENIYKVTNPKELKKINMCKAYYEKKKERKRRKMCILGKKPIAQSARACISNGQRLHISMDIDGDKNVMYDAISKTSSNTSAKKLDMKLGDTIM